MLETITRRDSADVVAVIIIISLPSLSANNINKVSFLVITARTGRTEAYWVCACVRVCVFHGCARAGSHECAWQNIWLVPRSFSFKISSDRNILLWSYNTEIHHLSCLHSILRPLVYFRVCVPSVAVLLYISIPLTVDGKNVEGNNNNNHHHHHNNNKKMFAFILKPMYTIGAYMFGVIFACQLN